MFGGRFSHVSHHFTRGKLVQELPSPEDFWMRHFGCTGCWELWLSSNLCLRYIQDKAAIKNIKTAWQLENLPTKLGKYHRWEINILNTSCEPYIHLVVPVVVFDI